MEDLVHDLQIVTLEHLDGLWKHVVQEFGVDLVAQVLDQSHLQVKNAAMDGLKFWLAQEGQQLLHHLLLVQNQ